jgi:general secretion pathway protein B
MSFILDALKKSEMERQRQTVPGLMDTRFKERRTGLPLWAAALCVLLGVNLLVLTFVLWNKSAPAPHAARPAESAESAAGDPAARPAADAAPPTAQHFSPLDPSPVYAPEIPVPAAEPAAVPAKPAAHTARRPDPVLTNTDAQTEDQEVLPSINELNLSGAQALPELHLEVHVYASRPADRFVYINMRKYHEGAALQEGPTIERIRRDGVVLNYQGLKFVLPRQP